MKRSFGRLKGAWSRYLEKLAAANKKNFGEGPLDCCNLKKEGKDKPKRRYRARED